MIMMSLKFSPTARTRSAFSRAARSALLGLRYNFGVVRPAPAVAEMPAPPRAPEIARTYLVFFDCDRSNLTDRARQIIADATHNTGFPPLLLDGIDFGAAYIAQLQAQQAQGGGEGSANAGPTDDTPIN